MPPLSAPPPGARPAVSAALTGSPSLRPRSRGAASRALHGTAGRGAGLARPLGHGDRRLESVRLRSFVSKQRTNKHQSSKHITAEEGSQELDDLAH